MKDHVKTQEKITIYESKKMAPEEINPANTMDLDF
jgi:hypothetical protein